MKGQIDMLFSPKPQHKKILLGILVIALLAGIAILVSSKTKNDTQIPLSDKSPSLEELRQEMDRVAKYEFEHGCLEKNERGQDIFCGDSKTKVDQAEARYQAALRESMKPDSATVQADTEAIQKFMGDPAFNVAFSRSSSPVNFNVGVITKLSDAGDRRIDTPDEWERTVNVYTATKQIEGICEVYEYEVYPKTHDVVEVRVVFPEGYDRSNCPNTGGSLFEPFAAEAQIKESGAAYLKRAVGNNYSFIVKPLERSNTSRWEWKWEDTAYKLPSGIAGDSAVDSRPTIRLHISSAGKLLQYNNTIPLFEN